MQKETIAGVGLLKPNPVFSIQVEETVFKRLSAIATKEGIDINTLGSLLLKNVLMLHRSEVNRAIDTVKRRNK